MLTTLQAMEIVTNADSDADMLPVDSESGDEDLLQPERNRSVVTLMMKFHHGKGM